MPKLPPKETVKENALEVFDTMTIAVLVDTHSLCAGPGSHKAPVSNSPVWWEETLLAGCCPTACTELGYAHMESMIQTNVS